MQTLPIRIFNSPQEAPHYKGTDFKGAKLTSADIVLKGMESGKATVDLIFEVITPEGETVDVAMAIVPGSFIKALASTIEGAEQR